MKYRDYKVGSLIDKDGTMLQVVKTPSNVPVCKGCFYSDFYRRKHGMRRVNCCDHGMICTKYSRKDRHHVIFIKVDV